MESVLKGDKDQTYLERFAERQSLLGNDLTPGQMVCSATGVLSIYARWLVVLLFCRLLPPLARQKCTLNVCMLHVLVVLLTFPLEHSGRQSNLVITKFLGSQLV